MSRLTQLENAHRALAAQHTALLEFCRAFLPLIPAAPNTVRQAIVNVYDQSNANMDEHAMDAEFQAAVRRWLDNLSSTMTVVRTR